MSQPLSDSEAKDVVVSTGEEKTASSGSEQAAAPSIAVSQNQTGTPASPLQPFKLERHFARYEFANPDGLLCCSDMQALSLKEVLAVADNDSKVMYENLTLGYTESAGHPDLRKEVAGLYSKQKPENVIICVPEEAIYVTFRCLLRQGEHIIVMSPAYQSLHEVARGQGAEVTEWPLMLTTTDGKAEWQLDLRALAKAVKPNTKAIVINTPHNPTGRHLTWYELATVVQLAKKHDLYLFSDEMYRFLEYSTEDRLPAVCDIYDKGISLGGMSKCFALAGLRLGWLATKSQQLLQAALVMKDYTTICNSAPSELIALMALRACDTILKRNIEILTRNLALLDTFFARYPTLFRWVRPNAGSVTAVELLPAATALYTSTASTGVSEGNDGGKDGQAAVSAAQFCDYLLTETGLMLLPSTVFGADDRYVRLGFGRTNMPRLLDKLRDFIDQRLAPKPTL